MPQVLTLASFHQEMVMIAHQTPGPHPPLKPPAHPAEVFDKHLPVIVVQENVRASIAPDHHMVERAFEFDAKRTGHGDKLAESTA